MIITYPDQGYFKIQSGNLTILINPTNQRSFKGATLILNTTKPAQTEPTDGELIWIDHQGEYEIKGVQVWGWSVGLPAGQAGHAYRQAGQTDQKEKTIYRVIFENFKILILGDLDKAPTPEIQNQIQKPDIVLGPANSKINKWLKILEPKLIVPALAKNSEVQELLKEFNQKESKPEEKLTLKLKDLESDKTIIRCLKF